ncbi:hypothetical protein FQA39_LY14531 [Lamprigera yunnana]|nr:hypothetical protein FQA39_LY14531 [Lamprigera yunnana]
MDFDSDDEVTVEENYYAFLNVSKEATKEEISNAYRNLSRVYHPDKHLDPENKAKAEILFNKTKKAYEILSDPHQRAIYDSVGVKGLETEGWEIVQRTKTPAEIRAEYEQLAIEKAERQKQQRTNPHGAVTININATDLFNPYVDDYNLEDDLEVENLLIPSIEISGMNFSQSVELPLTQKDTCTLAGQLQTRNGTGGGGINLSWRRIFSHKSWGEVEMLAGNGPAISLKAFRTLSKRFFWNGGTVLQFTPQGIRPGIMSTLALQVDKHSVAYFTYHGGLRSSLSTSIIKDSEFGLCNFSIQLGLPHSFVSISYTKKMLNQELRFKIAVKGGTFGGALEYGAEKKVSKHSWLAVAVNVGVPTGVKLKIKLTRGNQTYSFPIHLCEEVIPSAVFYATVVPFVVYIFVKKGIVEPFHKEQHAQKIEREKQKNRIKLLEKRKEALAAIDLMTVMYARICNDEETKKGLIIVRALYGKIFNEPTEDDEMIDVTIPLQCLVKNSKLVLHEQSKSQLPGFYDPAVGENKFLLIEYSYQGQTYETTIGDNESLRLPKPYVFRLIKISLRENDIREVVLQVLKCSNLSTEYVDKIPKSKKDNVQIHRDIDLEDDPFYSIFAMNKKVNEKRGSLKLKTWIVSNYNVAQHRSEMHKPVREELSRLKKNFLERLKILDIRWDCGWNEQHFMGCLQSLKDMVDQYPEQMELLKGRVLVFAPFSGVSLDGHVMLYNGEVRNNWLDSIKNIKKNDKALERIPAFERAISQVLLDIQVVRRKFMPKTQAANYERYLQQLTTNINNYLGKRLFPSEWPKSLKNYEIVVENEAGPLMLSPTGQFITPSSCPGLLLIKFITENLTEAAIRIDNYKRDKYVERSLHQQCMDELHLPVLYKDDNVTPELMIHCCNQLLKHKNDLENIKGLHLYITTYYSILTDGTVCIPWNWT